MKARTPVHLSFTLLSVTFVIQADSLPLATIGYFIGAGLAFLIASSACSSKPGASINALKPISLLDRRAPPRYNRCRYGI